jgi:glucokinase
VTAPLLALDLGATKLRWGLVLDSRASVLLTEPTPHDVPILLQTILASARRLLDQHPGCRGLAVAAAGQISREGAVVGATRVIRGWAGTRLREDLEQGLGLPVAVVNDAKAAALAHWQQRPGSRLMLVSLGTGIGAGVVYEEGTVEIGATGRGGELGHTLFRYGGRRCPCGRRGCAEAYLSGPALTARASRVVGEPMPDLEAVLRRHDPALDRLWQRAGAEVAALLVSWDMIFECDRYILAGGVTEAAPQFLPPLQAALAASGRLAPERVTLSDLGDESFLLGAATYWEREAVSKR